ncbi:MAG: hypothetical protein ACFB0G_15435 [Leptolyngbyaceae cyanobacterium]
MFDNSLARLKQENEKLRKRLAATQQLGLRGDALKAFETHCLTNLELDQQGNISGIQGRDGQRYTATVWLERARQGQEGPAAQALLATNDSQSEISQPHVGVEQLKTLSAAQLEAIARGDLVVTISVLDT